MDTTGIKHLFTGVEAEGMWKGFPTVFITQDYLLATSLVAQIDLLAKREEPHVYLGASGRHLTPGDWPHVRALLDKLPNKLFTVETDLDDAMTIPTWACDLWRLRVIASKECRGVSALSASNVEVKLEAGHLAVIYNHPAQVVDLSYVHDKEITP